ncbi:ABC transporter ATP-binding protein [Filifactor villosus]|uniref:ABC transporter ATP-binding protein n=1 Tax=Filifactor villosus TaxID=29374 RepID=A0ABV9QL90_9FIRM
MQKPSIRFTPVFGRLFQFMRPYRNPLLLSIVLAVLAAFFSSLGPFILGRATDALLDLKVAGEVSKDAVSHFVTMLCLFGGVYLLYASLKFLSSKILVRVSQKTIFDLRSQVDAKLKKLPLNYFDTNTYGDVLSRITNDVDIVSNSLQQSLEQFITSIVTVICILTMMLWINPILTLIGVLTIPLSMVVSMTIVKSSRKHFSEQQEKLGTLNGYVEEIYTGHSIVSAFNAQQEVISAFEKQNDDLYRSAWKAQFLSSTLMPITQGMSNLGYVAVVVVSGWLVINGRMSIGMIQSFIQYLRQFSQPIIQTVQIANILQSAAAAASRVFDFLDEEEELPDHYPARFPDKKNAFIEFEHVRFGYSSENTLMHDVNLKVDVGRKVAIVGPTGAGKTTLVNLLLRFYDVEEGSIKIGGIDIWEMKRTDLRSIFGMVLQDTWLFTGSIMDNLRYGRLDATDEEVFAAAKTARADSFINTLPGGYDFQLQENGANLAQGERQLLTIARAILSDSPVMILDEATSSVDTRTEVLIQHAMASLMRGRTSFIIAHRLSTIKDADIIVYMEDGDIKETGSHDELIRKRGLYANLYNSQFDSENQA